VSDIVERLRFETGCAPVEITREAAEEIEKLRQRLHRAELFLSHIRSLSDDVLTLTDEAMTTFLTQHWPHCTALKTGVPGDCNCPHRMPG
jgi:hypothetical protein